MEAIDNQNFIVVVDDDGNPLPHNDMFLIQRKTDDQLFSVDNNTIKQVFNIDVQSETVDVLQHNEQSSYEYDKDNYTRQAWSRQEVLALINLYKEYETEFKKTSIKNDKVWKVIANAMGSHTVEQIKNKFKYLKQKYTAKKDNMKDKSSGSSVIRFEYFAEMDNIFGKNDNIKPRFIASSIRGPGNCEAFSSQPDDQCKDEDSNKPSTSTPKICSTPAQKTAKKQTRKRKSVVVEPNENILIKEAAKQKRQNAREESMNKLCDTLNTLSNVLDKFSNGIDKFAEVLTRRTDLF